MAARKRGKPVELEALLQEAAKLRSNITQVIGKMHDLEDRIHEAHLKAHSVHLESEKPPTPKRRIR